MYYWDVFGERVCEEGGNFPDSPPYVYKNAPFYMLICRSSECEYLNVSLWGNEQDIFPYEYDLDQWIPKSINQVQLVLCHKKTEEIKLGNCRYTGGNPLKSFTVPLVKKVEYWDLIEAKTGKKIITFTASSSSSVTCPTYLPPGGMYTYVYHDAMWKQIFRFLVP
jgi:hypothetical protein